MVCSAPVSHSRTAAVRVVTQQLRDLLKGVVFSGFSAVKSLSHEGLLARVVVAGPAPNGGSDRPADAGRLAIRQVHMAPPDHDVLLIIGRAGTVLH